MRYRLTTVDVFGSGHSFSGNPVAVVAGAEDLPTAQMLRITRWFNLAETTFLVPPTDPEADYAVRIFTLDREMPFAGHPTLGTCQAWLAAGGKAKNTDRIVQQCGAGLIPIRRINGRLAFAGPPLIRSGPVEDEKLFEVAQFLGISRDEIIEAEWADNGPGWVGVILKDAKAVLALNPRRSHTERIDVGVIGAHPPGGAVDLEIRTFFTDHNRTIIEDPITGSFNAAAANWLFRSGRINRDYIAAQGTMIGRTGRVYISRDDAGAVLVGGETHIVVTGNLEGPKEG